MNTLRCFTLSLSMCCSVMQAAIPTSAIKNRAVKSTVSQDYTPKNAIVESAGVQDTTQSTEAARPLKIVIVNLGQAIGQLLETKDIEQDLTTEDQAKRKELEELANEAKKLQEDLTTGTSMLKSDAIEKKRERIMEIQRTIELRAQNYEQARQRKTQEIQVRIFKDVETIAEQIRKEMGIDIIMAGSVLAFNPKFDITNSVVERMNKAYSAKKSQKNNASVKA